MLSILNQSYCGQLWLLHDYEIEIELNWMEKCFKNGNNLSSCIVRIHYFFSEERMI